MKKILIICLFLIVFLVGCGEPTPPEVVIDYEKVGEITDSIDILYSEIENIKFSNEETQNEIIRIRNLYDELKQEEKDLITNFSDFEEIENMYKQYIEQKEKEEAEKQKIIDAVAEAVALCDTTVPKTSTGENIELPNSYTSEDGVSVYIGWTTSDPLTITNKGMVTQPRKSVVAVTLTAVCRSGDVAETFTRRVAVGPLAYAR
jgi:FtsZ-binding cell division protein ZapB